MDHSVYVRSCVEFRFNIYKTDEMKTRHCRAAVGIEF